MFTLKEFLKHHSLAVVFALIVGALSVMPAILAPLALGGDYKGFQFSGLDDEDIYRARIQEILDGHIWAASPYVYEYKDSTPPVPPINEYIYAVLACILGLSGAITFAKFLFPIILFFLVYFLVLRLTQEGSEREMQWCGVAVGLFVTLGFDLVDYRNLLSILLYGTERAHLLVWTRTVNPITSGLVLFAFLISLWKVLGQEGRFPVVLSATLLAFSVAYFFAFGLGVAVLGVLILLELWKKNHGTLQRLLWVLFLSLLIEIPYWYSALSMVGGVSGREFSERNGMFFTHAPMVNKMLVAASIAVGVSLVYAWRKKIINFDDKRILFNIALLGGGWLSFNQQILTGRAIWPAHFVQYTIPFSIISVFTIFYIVWRPKFPRLWRFMLIVTCVASLSWGVFSALSYQNKLKEFSIQQSSSYLTDWLNENASKDSVVFLKEFDEQLERLIPAYTSVNVYSTTYGFFGITKERILHNYLLRLRLNGITNADIHEYLLTHEDEVRGYFFSNWNQMFGYGRDAWFLGRVAYLEGEYRKFLERDPEEELLRYRVDYFVSQVPLSQTLQSELFGITLVAQVPGYFIYVFPR